MPVLTKETAATDHLFGGAAEDPVTMTRRRDRYRKAIADEPWCEVDNMGRTIRGNMRVVNSEKSDTGQLIQVQKMESVDQATERVRSLLRDDTINKAIGASNLASIEEALNLQKDISLTSPIGGGTGTSTGLTLVDLHGPAEELVPVDTPLRNTFPRTAGVGTAFQYKQITGFSNAQTGTGLPLLHPGILDTTQTNFAVSGSSNALYYNRGPKISYTGQNKSATYFQFGLSDEVTWSAFYSGQGFQDVRELSQTSTMYASFLAEERMTLYGRGTSANGYSGVVAAPATVTATPSTTGGTLAAGTTYHVWVAAVSGFGTSAATDSGAVTTTGSTSSISVYWTPVAGAVGYQVFFGATAGAANGYFVSAIGWAGNSTTAAITLTGPVPSTGATAPTADTSTQASGYDGILPICLSTSSGYQGNVNGKFSTVNPGTELQTAFVTMYNVNLARPKQVLANVQDRKQLSDLLKGSSATGFRIMIEADGTAGHQLGQIVTGIQNEAVGDMVDLDTHPYMPQGVMPILTHQLPFPNSNITNCWEYRNVQDYMGISWPQLQFSYDFSTYWYGTFFCHAQPWQGALYNIQPG
ncbi:hypothetical protein [Actinocrispum wychmicini]|uniref:Uncharacterized protein n=1 Tax=Actinocrispum wychmicini TaxID=1213861 RepID=A0A4V2S6R7_9PSEU|nr:hypothetical protein [Actinocrispum wychmicini]TCO57130.1 hypothetical protein EV192_106607 [Actinocrispum wychmicini]